MKKVTYNPPEIFPGKKIRYSKKHKGLYVFLSVLLVLSILAGGGLFYFKQNFSYNYNDIEANPEALGFEEVKDERIINIALFGIDTRSVNSFSGRSDTIMIMSVNTGTKKIKLISVMRDSLVPIENNSSTSYDKINSAYAKGGPELAIKTLNTIFDLDISEYISVNFFGLADIIDLIGGIEVELTDAEVTMVNSGAKGVCRALGIPYEGEDIVSSGLQHLDGKQAVGYARIRYTANSEGTNNDYGRTDRQRLVMERMFNKALSMEKTRYAKLVKPILASCQTSLTYAEVIDVVLGVLSSNPVFEETRIPETRYLIPSPKTSAGSVVYYDLGFAAKLIHNFIYKDIAPEKFIEENGIEKNNWYVNGFTPPKFEDNAE